MKLIKTYKYKLKLTKNQIKLVDSWIGACRYVYNLAKETKETAFASGVTLSKFDLINQLPDLKVVDWIKSVPAQTLQNSVERLDMSYQNYFRKLKNGEIQKAKSEYISKRISKGLDINEVKLRNFGKPKWAKKDKYNSIIFKQNKQSNVPLIRINNSKINLPKIGEVRIFKDRIPTGELNTAIIIKEHNSFFITVTFEYESENIYPTSENQVVGIDMGISYFSVDSNGIFIENPRHTNKYEKRLRVKNRELQRKVIGSNGFNKTKLELNKLHNKISNIRKDFLHKLSLKYVKENSVIVCEDLKVKNMIKNHILSKNISDVSWSSFFSMLKYKSESFEKQFIQINPKHTSQKCSICSYVSNENRLSQQKFECVKCGHNENADFNASKTILGEGITLKRKREALACA